MADTEQTRELAVIRDTLVAAHQNHGHVFVGIGLARAILASQWLLARDERIRADEREKLAAVLPDHIWRGGYYCQCGHELNSAAGWFTHLVDSARLAGEVEAR